MQYPSHFQHLRPLCAALAAMGLFAGAVQAQEAQAPAEMLVQSGRLAQKQFDTPASVRAIDGDAIRNAGAQVNLSEALAQVPGVVALNRNNYAQDLQISIRGFGARSAFGLRGIRLITDGIPATTPDGQGQASTVSLTSAERIEVLTGPLAQLYGNSAGGVIQTWTREAGSQPQLDVSTTFGSYGLRRHDVQFSGRTGNVGIVADYSTFNIDGYRQNSAAERKQFNGVVTTQLQEDTRLKLVANVFDMPLAQDPLGLTAAQLKNDPRQAGNGALTNRTRKIVQHNQVGAVLDHRFSSDLEMQWRAYTGARQNAQYTASATWVGLDRDFYGIGGQLKGKVRDAAHGPVDWVLGFDADQTSERRQGGAAAAGDKVSGSLTRNELNKASNTDAFGQINWHWTDAQGRNPYTFTAGLRHSSVKLENRDDYLTDGNGSGSVRYTATNPVVGATWHALDTLNLFANWGKGFETPTLTESAYVVENNVIKGYFNTGLQASHSQHSEVGLKWTPSPVSRLDASLFRISTDNEIVTLKNSFGKTAYKNAAQTLREGGELSWQNLWTPQWRSQLSMAWLRANYDADFTSGVTPIPSGNRMPAIPSQQLFASLQWADQGFASRANPRPQGWSASADWVARSSFWASDVNDVGSKVAGYGALNLRVRHRSAWGPVRAELWAGVDNLMNRQYVGSVIVNQSATPPQYFEPGLPRNWMTGVKLSIPL
jgi:iron complex outermembrane receptor protein